MNIVIEWDDDAQTIIRYTFQEGWTLTEFNAVYNRASEMRKESPNRVIGIIVDDSQHARPPKNALTAFRRTVKEGKLPMVIVGIGHMAKILMEVAEGAFKKTRQIYYTETLEEARDILRGLADDEAAESGAEK